MMITDPEARCKGRYGNDPCGWQGTMSQLADNGVCPVCRGGHIVFGGDVPIVFDVPDLKRGPSRPSWAETWMAIAQIISERSYDPRLKVGAIVVTADNTQMLSVGYNGNYAGGPHEHESPEPGQSGFIHAETNALLKLDFNHPKSKIMYVTHSPCRMCAKLIINAGIKRVIYGIAYRDPSGVQLLKMAGVTALSIEDAIAYSE